MEHRAQTYLGALQLLAVIFGSLFLSAANEKIGDMLTPDSAFDPLRSIRILNRFAWLFLILPVAWVGLTIRAEHLNLRWASKGVIIGSGVALLGVITIVYVWGGKVALNVLAPLGGWW